MIARSEAGQQAAEKRQPESGTQNQESGVRALAGVSILNSGCCIQVASRPRRVTDGQPHGKFAAAVHDHQMNHPGQADRCEPIVGGRESTPQR
jgi:hypothetical protein